MALRDITTCKNAACSIFTTIAQDSWHHKATIHARSVKQARTDVHHGEQANANIASFETRRKPRSLLLFFHAYIYGTAKYSIACHDLHVQALSRTMIVSSVFTHSEHRSQEQKRRGWISNHWSYVLLNFYVSMIVRVCAQFVPTNIRAYMSRTCRLNKLKQLN